MSNANPVPKLIGGDVELGNFIIGGDDEAADSDYAASRLLLAQVDGLPRRRPQDRVDWRAVLQSFGWGGHGGSATPGDGRYSQDWGRKYLPTNGGCIYIDLNHLELATPEVLSARDYQAAWSAMLRIARQAQEAANAELEPDRRIVVLANNSDRQGHSYGGHQSFLMTRAAFDDMLRKRMLPSLFFLSAYQVSSIVFTGQGKVGSENGAPVAPFQISQRADFIECLLGEQTTFHRPLINTRDEPLCGSARAYGRPDSLANRYARLHVIFYDTNLAPVASYLKVGVMQLILAMIEADYVDEGVVLADPLGALREWSRDLDGTARMRLVSGETCTAVELQLKFLERASAFARHTGFDEWVPEAERILALWEDTLLKLEARDFETLRGRIDWVMKRAMLEQALAEHTDWTWQAPELTYLDQTYSSLDPADSLFCSLDTAGLFEPVATETVIARFVCDPPEDTRAWTRTMLLRAAGPGRIADVDWDELELASATGHGARVRLELADPLGATRADVESAFLGAADFPSLTRALEAAGIVTVGEPPVSQRSGMRWIPEHSIDRLN